MCPDGIERVGRYTNKAETNVSVRVGDRAVKGKLIDGNFMPTGDGKNGNPFRWILMADRYSAA